jgi:hypothetical protein
MIPREFDSVVAGLREFRDEEAKAMARATASAGGKQSMGGEPIHNA